MLHVCICTHNPRLPILEKVLDAVARQELSGAEPFAVLIVDNASNTRLDENCLAGLKEAGIDARIVFEATPGVSRARLRAIDETDGDWILFVDDDNELAADYIRQGQAFIASHPHVGCFGGKLLLAPDLDPDAWVHPFLPYLGIKDYGDQPMIEMREEWGPWEPPTAGAWVCRRVLEAYADCARKDARMFGLGRSGQFDLASCEDSLMMRGAVQLGLACAYYPPLRLYHHLSPHRFRYEYLLPLIAAYGRSQVLLEKMLGRTYAMTPDYRDGARFDALLDAIFDDPANGARFRSAMMAWHITAKHQTFALDQAEAPAV